MKAEALPSLRWLKADDIKIPDGRLHSHFDNHSDFEESVKTNGVIQPVHVFEDENGEYWLADGQNRLETAKSQGKIIIPAYVMAGTKQDAVLFSAKLNVLRGKVNVGELAEFVYNLRKSIGWGVEEIAENIRLSKSYVSKLLAVAENKESLENLKKGLISIEEAYKSSKSFVAKPLSQETRQEEKPTTCTPMKVEAHSLLSKQESQEKQPLTDEDLGITTNLKRALEEGKRFSPLGPSDLKPDAEPKKTEYMTCDYCGRILSRLDVKWIKVHSDEYDKVLLTIHSLAERETQKESSRP
jgi:ParB/RepB/Spo0J family partition protein